MRCVEVGLHAVPAHYAPRRAVVASVPVDDDLAVAGTCATTGDSQSGSARLARQIPDTALPVDGDLAAGGLAAAGGHVHARLAADERFSAGPMRPDRSASEHASTSGQAGNPAVGDICGRRSRSAP